MFKSITMLNRILSFSLLLSFCASSTTVLAGGPWPPGKGKGFFQLGTYFIPPTNEFFAVGGKTQLLQREIFDVSIQGYGEYGLTSKLWLTADLPFKIVSTAPELSVIDSSRSNILLPPNGTLPSARLAGLGNSSLGLNMNLYNKGVNISAGLNFTLPATSADLNSSLRTGAPIFGIMPKVAIGTGGARWYGFIETGLHFRFKSGAAAPDYSHEWLSGLELGLKIGQKGVYLSLFSQARISLKNHVDSPDSRSSLFVNNQEYVSFGLKGIIPIHKQMGFTLFFGGAFYAVHYQKALSLGLGFYYKL
jgi:hypothetical protein